MNGDTLVRMTYGAVSRCGSLAYYGSNLREVGLLGQSAPSTWVDRVWPRAPRASDGRPVWLHMAGPGDAKAGLEFLRELRTRLPDMSIHLTYGTRMARACVLESPVVEDQSVSHGWFPIDATPRLGPFLRHLNPRIFVNMQGEIWPLLFRALARLNVLTVALRVDMFCWDSQREFPAWIRPHYAQALSYVNFYSARTPRHRDNLLDLDVPPERVTVGGDYRLSHLPEYMDTPCSWLIKALDRQQANVLVWAGPSTEEVLVHLGAVVEAVAGAGLHLVIAPVGAGDTHFIARILKRSDMPHYWLGESTCPTRPNAVGVFRRRGALVALYRLSWAVLLGESFPERQQGEERNYWEALSQGCHVIAGPAFAGGPEGGTVLERGWVTRLNTACRLPDVLECSKEQHAQRRSTAKAVAGYCAQQPSAAARDADFVCALLDGNACLELYSRSLPVEQAAGSST